MDVISLATLVADISIAASLIALIIQIHLQRRETRYSTYEKLMSEFTSSSLFLAEHQEIAEFIYGNDPSKTIPENQYQRFKWASFYYLDALLALFERVWVARQQGYLPQIEWVSWRNWLSDSQKQMFSVCYLKTQRKIMIHLLSKKCKTLSEKYFISEIELEIQESEIMSVIGLDGALEVRDCPHGKGVFAITSFRTGETIQSFSNIVITTNPSSPPWKRWALIIGRTQDGAELFWDEEPVGSSNYWSNFLDHDESPNVRFLIDLKKKTAKLVAIREIKSGEELFINYKEYNESNWTP